MVMKKNLILVFSCVIVLAIIETFYLIGKKPKMLPSYEKLPKNVLVVYYSATGSTKKVAETIAKEMNADIFALEPINEYTSEDLNYSNENSRVSKEHSDESLRDVKLKQTIIDDFDKYDTILIGYPIWWGIAAWPVNNFVKENNFTGKTVIPFCTSASSPLGESAKKLNSLNATGTWLDGKRFSSNENEKIIKEWVNTIK